MHLWRKMTDNHGGQNRVDGEQPLQTHSFKITQALLRRNSFLVQNPGSNDNKIGRSWLRHSAARLPNGNRIIRIIDQDFRRRVNVIDAARHGDDHASGVPIRDGVH